MHRLSIRLLATVATVSLLGSSVAVAREDAAAQPHGDGKLVVASLAPESGPLMPLLPSLRVPVQLAVDEINAAGGVGGAPVTLVNGDEGAEVATARATVTRFAGTDSVDAIVGPAAPVTTLGILSAIKRAGILMCSGSDTLARVSPRQSNGLYFRTAPPSRLEGFALAELVLSDGHRRVGVVRRNDSFGDDLSQTLDQGLRQGGARVVATASYDATQTDVNDEVGRVVAKKPDAIVVLGFDNDGATVLKGLIAQHAGPKERSIYAPDTMQSTSFAANVDPTDHSQVAGLKGTAPAPAPFDVQSPFRAKFAATGVEAIFSSHYYDCTILTALAAVKAKSDDPAKMKRAFTKNLTGKQDCNTYASCKTLLESGRSIHWRGASSNFERFGTFEPEQGVYDTWSYDVSGIPVIGPPSAQIQVP